MFFQQRKVALLDANLKVNNMICRGTCELLPVPRHGMRLFDSIGRSWRIKRWRRANRLCGKNDHETRRKYNHDYSLRTCVHRGEMIGLEQSRVMI